MAAKFAAPEARQPESSVFDPSTPSVAEEPGATLPPGETNSAPAVPTRMTKSARATRRVVSRRFARKRKTRQLADEASASDGALSYAQPQPALESVNPFDRLFSPRQPETSRVDPSTRVAQEPTATLPPRETNSAPAVATRMTKSARATRRVVNRRFTRKRKDRQLAEEASASDSTLSYAQP